MSEGILINPNLMVYFATITVTYPSGSTLTCSNGRYVLTAETTSGSYTFVVPYAATWTVKATKGSQSKSANVSVTTYNQSAKVTLTYELILFDNGTNKGLWGGAINQRDITDSNAGFSIANTLYLWNGGNWDYQITVDITLNSPIDFSQYKTIYVTFSTNCLVSTPYYFQEIRVGTTKYGYNSARLQDVYGSGTFTKSIDISNVSGNQYVDLYQRVTEPFSGGPLRLTVTKVWLA